ncbi:MAG: hypothetical protein ACTSR3_05890 [Candidatus Helarchaeota archaeon]
MSVFVLAWTPPGDINLRNFYEIINATNVSANYYFGQPIEGYLGSGIIWAEEFDDNGLLNVSASGLDVTYSGFIMRLVKTDNSVKYCNITGDTVTVPDNTHSVYYVDSDCNVQHTSIQNYIATDLSPGGLADFFNAVSQSGNIGILEGTSLMNKEDIRVRRNTFKLTNLDIISGMFLNEEGFSNITISSGEYSYIYDVFEASEQNTSSGDNIHLLYRDGGTWQETSQNGLNLTWCDDGTNSAACSDNKFRRYIIGLVGKNDTTDTTQLHQLAAKESETFNNLANCLDTVKYPLEFDLPSNFEYTFVLLYAYCGQRDDTSWDGDFIDLRTTQMKSYATGLPDLSIFLTRDGTRTLLNNWNAGDFNITAQGLNITNEIYLKDKTVYDWLYNQSLASSDLYVNKTGDTMTGDLNLDSANIADSNSNSYITFRPGGGIAIILKR